MANDRLKQLIDNCRTEMGPEVFREFTNDLGGRRRNCVRKRKHTCALCDGSGKKPTCMGGGECEGCDGTGKF